MATAALSGGSFYGAIQRRQEQCGAIFTDLRHSSARKLPAHSHELPFFALLLEGDYRERYRRQQMDFGPFTVSFRPAGIAHQDEVGPRGVRFFEIELRPSWKERIEDCSGTIATACDDCAGGELLWLALKLFRETRISAASDGLCVESLLAELVSKVASMRQPTARHAPCWLSRVRDKLNAEYCERLTLNELGNEAGVHPVHLSRVFRKYTGEGIGECVHRLRIKAACQRMLAPTNSLAEIAAEAGFADQSHFTRIFRRVTGMSPGAFRALVTAA
jgi:AraC family transcriptional regulator